MLLNIDLPDPVANMVIRIVRQPQCDEIGHLAVMNHMAVSLEPDYRTIKCDGPVKSNDCSE